MVKLGEVAQIVRSKNAGPFCLTIDVLFNDNDTYMQVKQAKAITAERVASLYKMEPESVAVTEYDGACGFKISMPRRIVSGDLGDSDVYGAQQHVPIADLKVCI